MRCSRLSPVVPILVLLSSAFSVIPALAGGPERALGLHAEYDRLLERYVRDQGVDYASWAADTADATALARYVVDLTALDPVGWSDADGLAYWINLYNAVTLRLIVDNYPLQSIKDLGGFLRTSPWKRTLVQVGERELSLNDIENEIIRPTYEEPRIHFALNCASVGCPPLQPHAYLPESLDEQLDAACEIAMNDESWIVVAEGAVRVTKIFDWYGDDFTSDGGSVVTFINRFRDGVPLDESTALSYLPYDWSLNQAP